MSFFLRQVGLQVFSSVYFLKFLQRGEDPIMTEFQIYALDSNGARISVCRDTKDFTNQQGRGKFQVSRDKMTGALRPDGSLLLICEVRSFSYRQLNNLRSNTSPLGRKYPLNQLKKKIAVWKILKRA